MVVDEARERPSHPRPRQLFLSLSGTAKERKFDELPFVLLQSVQVVGDLHSVNPSQVETGLVIKHEPELGFLSISMLTVSVIEERGVEALGPVPAEVHIDAHFEAFASLHATDRDMIAELIQRLELNRLELRQEGQKVHGYAVRGPHFLAPCL